MKVSPDFNARAESKPRDVAVQSKHERVTQFAEKQFERCKGQWTANYYDRLLKREGNAPSLQPSWGVQDRKTHLLRAAGNLAPSGAVDVAFDPARHNFSAAVMAFGVGDQR